MLSDERRRLLGLTGARRLSEDPTPARVGEREPRADIQRVPRITRSAPFPGGYGAGERDRTSMKEERHATEGVECQARASVRAHQGRAQGARPIRRPRRGDRRADGEQGARPVRRGEDEEPFVDAGHLVRSPWWPSLPHGTTRSHVRPALQRGEGARPEGPFEDVEGAAGTGPEPLAHRAAASAWSSVACVAIA